MAEIIPLHQTPAFDQFWAVYPHRISKKLARVAFEKAERDPEWPGLPAVIEAVKLYVRTKPDWQGWKHPATWLNQGCYLDEPATEKPVKYDWETSGEYQRRVKEWENGL